MGTGSIARSTNFSDRKVGEEMLRAEGLVRAPDARPEGSGQQQGESRVWLAAHLRAWERHRVTFGVAVPSFSPQVCGEYARVFHAGCIDVDSDGLPPPVTIWRCVDQVPPGFALTVMLTDETLVYRFPYGHPDRCRRGELNPGFLDPGPLQERLRSMLEGLDGTLDTVVLRIQPVYRTEELRAPEFVGRLDRFLGGLPRAYRYAVDLRTSAFNVPGYRACLRDHGVAHLLRHEPHFPCQVSRPRDLSRETSSLIDQVFLPGILSAPFCVARVHAGPMRCRDHEHEALALGVHELIRACGDEGMALTVLMDDGQEEGPADQGGHGRGNGERGNREDGDGGAIPAAPGLAHLLHALDGELARRSPLRRRAA